MSTVKMIHCDPVVEACNGKMQEDPKELCAPVAYIVSNQQDETPLVSLDIGGTFIKLVYYVNERNSSSKDSSLDNDDRRDIPFLDGKLKFLKYEVNNLDGFLEFLHNNQLLCDGTVANAFNSGGPAYGNTRILATGGGAYKYENLFKDRLGIALEKVDEVASSAAGANFLLKNVQHEAFTYITGKVESVDIDPDKLYPYLLVVLGTGVSFIKVSGDWKADLVFGTNFGSGTVFALAKLLTKCGSYDEFLEMSQRGDNYALDLTIGDIYGEAGYSKYQIPAAAVACSCGKVNSGEDISPNKDEIAASLLKGFTFQISSIACLIAKLIGSKRIFYGGSHTHHHASIMENITNAIRNLSNDEVQAVFLRHEEFLGAVGALSSHKIINFLPSEESNSVKQTSPVDSDSNGSIKAHNTSDITYEGDKSSPDTELNRLQSEVQKLQIDKAKLQAEIEIL